MSIFSKLFDPGKEDRRRAAGLADQGLFTGGGATGPGGITAGFDFTGGQANVNLGLGSFAPLLGGLQGLSQSGIDQAQGGLPPGLMELIQNSIGGIGGVGTPQSNVNAQGTQGLGQIFQSALGTATADPFDLGADISSRLRSLSERGNARRFNKFTDRLQRTGNLTSSTGTQRLGELEALEREEGLKFDLAGLQAGQSIQKDAFGRALGSFGGLEASAGRTFGEQFQGAGFDVSKILSQFGVGAEGFGLNLANQQVGLQQATAGAGAAQNLAGLPIQFLQAMLGAGGASSSTFFNAAGINQANADLAKSPLLEAIKAAGQVAGTVSGFGGVPKVGA